MVIIFINKNAIINADKNKQKGISLSISSDTQDTNFTTWSKQLRNIDCSVELCTMEYIKSPTDFNFTSVSDISKKVAQCKKELAINNKKITILKPHIGTVYEGDAFNRNEYMPSDSAAFFNNWKVTLLKYAAICTKNHIPTLCITCEQTMLTDNIYMEEWKDIIKTIRNKYPKIKLIIAYIHNEIQRDFKYKELNQEALSDYVDFIGLNSYVPIDRKDNNKYFDEVNVIYDQVKRVFNKKLIIIETGCTMYSETSNKEYIYPIYLNPEDKVDYTDQRLYLDVTLNHMLNNKNIDGVYLWHISPPFSILNDVQSKNIIQKWFGKVK